MAVNFTVDQILAMAPDAGSAKSGRELAVPRKWVSLGSNNSAAWGECQGSGSLPYQTRIDLEDVAFKCSCPSRKFPCKHSLGLFLMLVQQADALTEKEPPAWVTEWLSSRHSRAEKKVKNEEEGEKPVDAVAQAKRQEQRKVKVAAGITELDRFLQDTVRQGLATLQNKPYKFWGDVAARLVDAQASGLARLIKDCAGISATGEGWQERLLAKLGMIYLLVEAHSRLDQLPAHLKDEVNTLIGYSISQDELLKRDGVRDVWQVVGQRVEQEDRLRVQRTWLQGTNSQSWALVLSFAHGTAPLDNSLELGTAVDAELVFAPSASPLRALVKAKFDQVNQLGDFNARTVLGAIEQYSEALARSPWTERFPMALKQVVLIHGGDGNWSVRDQENRALPLKAQPTTIWQILSVSGGHPITLFGEWDGAILAPQAVATGSCFYRLS